MLQQIAARKKKGSDLPLNSPMGLVIAPGKELATQIHVSPPVYVYIPSFTQIPKMLLRESEAVDEEWIMKDLKRM